MFEIFNYTVNAILPLLLLVALGFYLKKINMASESFFKKCNTLVFNVFLPVLLFYNIYKIDSLGDINWQGIIYCLLAIPLLFGIGFVVSLAVDRSQRGVLIQCTFRSNYAIIGIPLAASLGGAKSVAFASVVSAFSIPLYNALAVIVLTAYAGDTKKADVRAIVKSILKNPLIHGVFAGIVVLLIRAAIPQSAFFIQNHLPFITEALADLAAVTSPLALIVLGAQFNFSAVKELLYPISLGVFMRLIAAPAVGISGALLCSRLGLLSVTATELPALIALFATPVAVSSAVMTGEIGGDEQLAGQLVVWTSIVSIFSLFAIIFGMRTAGLI